jgi:7-carboxy-7-deazaguanine synthase
MRLSELYTSVQCEGPNTGRMVQFVRFAGCNMRCPGWPCDTQHAIDPKLFMAEGGSQSVTPDALLEMVQAAGPWDLCLTGGEPFLQREAELQEFVQRARRLGYKVECFSNGSFPYPGWAISDIQFIMDWKLEGSGEAGTAIQVRRENASRLKRTDAIKFVVVDETDMEEAVVVWNSLRQETLAQFWMGAAWDRISTDEVIEFVQKNKLPFNINVQVHKMLWNPDARGV